MQTCLTAQAVRHVQNQLLNRGLLYCLTETTVECVIPYAPTCARHVLARSLRYVYQRFMNVLQVPTPLNYDNRLFTATSNDPVQVRLP